MFATTLIQISKVYSPRFWYYHLSVTLHLYYEGRRTFQEGRQRSANRCIASLRSQVVRQAHEREHFPVAKTKALLNKKYWIPNIRDKIRKLLEIAFLAY
jgi:hypothetical protein